MKPEQSGLEGRMADFSFEIVPNTEQASPNFADKEGSQTDMDAWLNSLFDELGY
jgi:hypothetical protein